MAIRLKDQVALVTGGGHGIGQAISLAFAGEGADVVLASRNEARLQETASRIRDLGRRALVQCVDVSQEADVRRMVHASVEQFGRVDILVNNAGIHGPSQEVADLRAEDWDQTLAVNLRGAFLAAKYALLDMRKRRAGSIINISSVASRQGVPHRAPYVASKWGMVGLSHSIAVEVAQYNVRVNCVCPGATNGSRLAEVIKHIADGDDRTIDDVSRMMSQNSALGRFLEPEEIAAVAVFLASEEASGITGQSISVCGGWGSAFLANARER